MILEDVRRRQNGPSSILAFSSSCTPPDGRITPGSEWSVHPADYPNNINHPLFQVLRDLSDEGVTIVTSTGNQGTDDPAQPFHGPDSYRITSMPAIFNDRLPIIAVGSIKNDGTPSPIQPYLAYPPFWPNAEIDVYAPGYPAICDQGPLHRYGAPVYGSSAPTASVAGLVAYYLGTRGHVDLIHQEWVRDGRKTPRSWAETVKAYVVGRSYERQYRQPLPLGPPQASNAVWNGETEPGSCPVPAAVASTDKRQADDSPSDKSSSCAISCRIYPNHWIDSIHNWKSRQGLLWYQSLTAEQIELYKSDPAVAGIDPIVPGDPEMTIKSEKVPQPESGLSSASDSLLHDPVKRQVPSVPIPIPDVSHEFANLDPGAQPDLRRDESNPMFPEQQPRVYIHDSGFDKSGPTYKSLAPGQLEWMHIPGNALPPVLGTFETVPREDDPSPILHGSCMLAKAVGGKFAVSKRAKVTVIRRPKRILSQQEKDNGAHADEFPTETVLLGLQLILEDVRKRKSGMSSVVSYSFSLTPGGLISPTSAFARPSWQVPNHKHAALFSAINDLVDEGVTIVVASGNQGSLDVNEPWHGPITYQLIDVPSNWNDKLPLISVGSIQADGKRSPLQPYLPYPPYWPNAHLDIYAPGHPVYCDNGPVYSNGFHDTAHQVPHLLS
ncbi:Subtilisin-like protein [Glarea lozoyensis ATCC 20868]|uniref:Subtilisin-like protein n=1 Tax=Glarea lozoyensis (strain ATCC 20868 / MF5171) TaxID=1116229 RepID=S3D337_GLAL2|nr:Subtilisin-like protein [Glarea lozoyensis ATCC 20868]EPE26481.1 Subtilisin-like protein [Glarea lozoyensis ATCC 20868]